MILISFCNVRCKEKAAKARKEAKAAEEAFIVESGEDDEDESDEGMEVIDAGVEPEQLEPVVDAEQEAEGQEAEQEAEQEGNLIIAARTEDDEIVYKVQFHGHSVKESLAWDAEVCNPDVG